MNVFGRWPGLLAAFLVPASVTAALVSPTLEPLEEEWEDPICRPVNIQFAGGSATEYVDAVTRASGFTNVLFDRERLALLGVPPASLRRVSVEAALRIIADAPLMSDRGPMVIELYMVEGEPEEGTLPAVRLMAFAVEPEDGPGRDPAPEIGAFWIGGRIERGVTVEDLGGLIELSLDLAGIPGDIAMRYHEQTEILLVRGSPQQIDLIEQILAAVPDEEPAEDDGEEFDEESEENEEED